MPVNRICIGALLLACSQALVAEDEIPDMEFLEYLGSWEGSDEDWTMFAGLVRATNETDKRSDPAPEGEESTETYDEE
ncbi:MAG: hypothetical protein O2907_01170 [Proteobacteria bacterium]|nr:hypothetical protein [Pseudomonadota bacterium]